MTRVMASGDHHFDDESRFAECIRVHRWMVQEARGRSVNLFLSGGDIFERGSSPTEREAVADWLTAMATVCPVVISKGNHDRPLDAGFMRRLRTKHPIIVEEAAGVHVVAGVAVAAVAWPDRSRLLAQAGSQSAADDAMRMALQAVLRGLGDQLAQHDAPRVLLGHFMCDGAETSTGQPLLGQPIRVGLDDLALARAHLILMAHIHMYQIWSCNGAPALYTGSPFRTTFGQLETKSVTLAEFDGQTLVDLQQLETPATRMVQLEEEWLDPDGTGDRWVRVDDGAGSVGVRDAEVRLRLYMPSDKREAARAAAEQVEAELLKQGAVSVKREDQVITEKRARAPEVSQAITAADKLEAYWKAKGYDPGERRPSIIGKAQQLDERYFRAT
jgi:DNA repair exonuclease SbcCD nuclease subunit